jgi:hypothetical protein
MEVCASAVAPSVVPPAPAGSGSPSCHCHVRAPWPPRQGAAARLRPGEGIARASPRSNVARAPQDELSAAIIFRDTAALQSGLIEAMLRHRFPDGVYPRVAACELEQQRRSLQRASDRVTGLLAALPRDTLGGRNVVAAAEEAVAKGAAATTAALRDVDRVAEGVHARVAPVPSDVHAAGLPPASRPPQLLGGELLKALGCVPAQDDMFHEDWTRELGVCSWSCVGTSGAAL